MSKQDFEKENIDTLHKYGHEFQSKLISGLLTDNTFLQQIYDLLDPRFFESDASQWIVKTILWHFETYKTAPTMVVFKSELSNLDDFQNLLKVSTIEELKIVFKNLKATDLNYVKAEFLTFCKNQALKNAVLKSADLLQKGQYDEIKGLVDRATRAGQEKNLGHEWAENLDFRVTKVARDTIETPWRVINDLLDGGLGPGELGCIVANSGQGKSFSLCAIAAEALRQGRKVVYYTLELSETYVGLRFDSIFSRIEASEIKNNKEKVQLAIENIPGDLIIKYFPTRTATANTLHAHLNQLIQTGFKPDLVIVDYPDLMISTAKASARWEELGIIYEELRSVCGEIGVPMWICSQSRRSSASSDVIETDDIAGAYAKIFVSDFVMSISRKLEDKIAKTARIHVMKNRFGADGKVLAANMDLSIGSIEIFDEDSSEGMLLKNKLMKNSTNNNFLKKKVSEYFDSEHD